MDKIFGRIDNLKIGKRQSGKLLVSFQVVDAQGKNRSHDAAKMMLPSEKYEGLGEVFTFRTEKTHGITAELDILMRATQSPTEDTPMRIELWYAPENSKTHLPTEAEALAKVPALLMEKHIVSAADAVELYAALEAKLGNQSTRSEALRG